MINLILITMAVSFSSFAEITALEEEILLGPVSPKNLTTGAIERNKQLYLYKESVLEQDMDGYVILAFDIEINGSTSNHAVIEGKCIKGRVYPYEDCTIFNSAALNNIST